MSELRIVFSCESRVVIVGGKEQFCDNFIYNGKERDTYRQ